MSLNIKLFFITMIGALLFFVAPSASEAQHQDISEEEKAEKLFDWAESLVPDILIPLDTETRYFLGIHYRHYHTTDIMLATFDDHFFYIHGDDIHRLGEVDYWLDYIEDNATGSFFGNAIESALDGLFDAAQGKLDDEILGFVLSLLGWGDDGNEQDHKLLESMDKKLDEIVNILQAISGELEDLEKMLQIEEEEILANVNDPTSSITQINTFQDELQNLNKDKKPGGVSTDKVLDFAAKVEDNYQIENDVNAIHDAILPPTIAKSPVLDNLTELCINRVSKGEDLTDAYHMLELYFSQLLYNQVKGVNLVVEAKLAREKSGDYEKGTAEHYMDHYKTKILAPQVENFQTNVWKLILSQVDPINPPTFLPSQAGNILARTDFFAAQVLAEEAGIRGYIISTADLYEDAPHLSAVFHEEASKDLQGADWIEPKNVKMNTASGKPYAYWKGKYVFRGLDYHVISYNFGNQDPGKYDIYEKNGSQETLLISSVVNKYNHDYQKDEQGDINYGSFVISKRVDPKVAFDQNVEWTWHKQDMENASSMGSASSRYVGVSGSNQSEEHSGTVKLHANFVYAGKESAPITIHYHARVSGSASVYANVDAAGNARSHIYYSVGIADAHTGEFLHHDVGAKDIGDNRPNVSLHNTVTTQFTLRNPIPGREYFIYFNAEISGSSYRGNSSGSMKLDNIKGNQYINF